jgi:hypothetical protein
MASSETILPIQVHPGDSSAQTVRGEKYKGDGYYSRADGLHTVQIRLSDFVGTIEIEGTLAVDPEDPFYTNCSDIIDWSPVLVETPLCVSTTGLWQSELVPFKLEYNGDPETSTKVYNFTGNYTWIRAYITEWVGGTINSIKMNH